MVSPACTACDTLPPLTFQIGPHTSGKGLGCSLAWEPPTPTHPGGPAFHTLLPLSTALYHSLLRPFSPLSPWTGQGSQVNQYWGLGGAALGFCTSSSSYREGWASGVHTTIWVPEIKLRSSCLAANTLAQQMPEPSCQTNCLVFYTSATNSRCLKSAVEEGPRKMAQGFKSLGLLH